MGLAYTLLSAAELLQSTYQPIVRIEVQWSNGQRGWGSGVLVGANDVLTAAHLLGSPDHATIKNIAIYPAYYYGASMGGVLNASHWSSINRPTGSSSIYASEVRGDLAMVSLPVALGLSRGYWNLGIDFTQGVANTVGYPGTLNGAPAVSSGWVNTLSVFESWALDISTLYSQPGSSGSPIYVLDAMQHPTVIGVLSTGTWAVNITDTSDGQFDLAWVTQQISLNNLDAASSLPTIGVSDGLVKLGRGMTQLTLHYPVTLSYALAVDTRLTARLLNANGQELAKKGLLIPAGAVQTLIDLSAPLPLDSAKVNAHWTLVFSDADNGLFVSSSSASLVRSTTLTVEGSNETGQVGGSTLPETVVLSAGDDFYQGLEGDDVLTGGMGVDTAIYRGARKDYQLQRHAIQGDWRIEPATKLSTDANSDGTDTLIQFERLRFKDVNVALDLESNAGTAVKILGAVFGKSAVTNKEYVGIGLDLLDKGMSYDTLAGLALNVAKATTNDQIVTSLWTNVIGSAPSTTDKALFIKMLEDGMTPGALAHLAADTALNVSNINLVGLTQTGIEYTLVT